MGQEPEVDKGVIVDEPDYDAQGDWNLGVNYAVAGSSCNFNKVNPAFSSVFQIVEDLEKFYWYIVEFEIKAINFFDPNAFIEVNVGGNIALTQLKTVGTHKALVQNFVGGFSISYSAFLTVFGDTYQIELYEVYPASNYPQDQLGIDYPGAQKTEVYPGTGADVSQILASRDGKTNVGILYNL